MGAGDKFKTYKHKIKCPSNLQVLAFHNSLEILSRRQCFKKCVHVCVCVSRMVACKGDGCVGDICLLSCGLIVLV